LIIKDLECRRGDSNPHELKRLTWPSTMRVYQIPPLRRRSEEG
jgi:hypothetical protein